MGLLGVHRAMSIPMIWLCRILLMVHPPCIYRVYYYSTTSTVQHATVLHNYSTTVRRIRQNDGRAK
jgi:hypothetical protein